MDISPLNIDGHCVASDTDLIANMKRAIACGYPEIPGLAEERPGHVAIVASGPSVATMLDAIRHFPGPVVAVRDAHDWLIANGKIPDYGFTVDPLPDSWHCFERKHPDVEYVIASQCDKAVFDHLEGHKILTWHTYMHQGQTEPAGKFLIPGLSTSGLRAIAVFYALGYRSFDLFGFDSCLSGPRLRINGTGVDPADKIFDVRLEPDGEVFYTNSAMALQAQHFLDIFDMMPGIDVQTHGHGLIPAILAKYRSEHRDVSAEVSHVWNDRVSFIHSGGDKMASYRYRSAIPADGLGASINDLSASVLVFSKPRAQEMMDLCRAKARGQKVIVDFCDDHFKWLHYKEFLQRADVVTCPTPAMRDIIAAVPRYGRSDAIVIPDPYEYPLEEPHCRGWNCLWFGHSVNQESLYRILDDVKDYPLRVVGNFSNAITWSYATMLREFKAADVVLMPATDTYKSPNRTVEAIRQGCFVIAEPHPAINDFPGIWIGNIKEGLEWLKRQSVMDLSERITLAQKYVEAEFSPRTVTDVWRRVIQSLTTSAQDTRNGMDGSMSDLETMQT